MQSKSALISLISWACGICFSAIGLINTFWGNDPQFGLFIILLSFIFYPPANNLFTKLTRFSIPVWIKIIVGLFILWASLGVGELFDKVDMMLESFGNK